MRGQIVRWKENRRRERLVSRFLRPHSANAGGQSRPEIAVGNLRSIACPWLCLARIGRSVSIRCGIVRAWILRVVGWIALVRLRIRAVARWIAAERARRAARRSAAPTYGDAIFHSTIPRKRTCYPVRRLFLFAGLYGTSELNRVVGHIDAE